MRTQSRLLPCLVVVAIIVGLSACAWIGRERVTVPTPTEVLVIPVNKPGIVNSDTVPVRLGPGVEYELAWTLSRNLDITVVGQSGDGKWYKVEFPDYSGDQSSFWVAADFVTLISLTETVTITVAVSTLSLTPTGTITAQVLNSSPSATLRFPTSSIVPPTNTLIPNQTHISTSTGTPPAPTSTFTSTNTLIPNQTHTSTSTGTPPAPTSTFTPIIIVITLHSPTFTNTVIVSPAASTPAGTP
jgi:hypothetical protein